MITMMSRTSATVAIATATLLWCVGAPAHSDERCLSLGAEAADVTTPCTALASVPIVRTPMVRIGPPPETVASSTRIVKKGIAPEVLEFLRRMHSKIMDSQEYPINAVKLGLQGTTTVKISLLPDGQAESVRVRKSSGHQVLDQAAVDAVHRVLPLVPPPEAGNQPLQVDVPINFSLR
jgi:periplasmic protein TonB